MNNGEAEIVEVSKNGGSSGPDPKRVFLLGEGFAARIWNEQLRSAGASFVHLFSKPPVPVPDEEPSVMIETEDMRFADFLDEVMDGDLGGPHPEDSEPDFLAGSFSERLDEDEPRDERIVVAPGGVIFAPCYGVSPTQMAAAFRDTAPNVVGYTLFPRPEKSEGNHVIEIGRALQTSDATWDRAQEELAALGFRAEVVGDAPGGVFGRTVCCLINEAAMALGEGLASIEDMDNAMRMGVNYPKGLFEWADSLGIDLVLEILDGLFDHYNEDRYRAAPLLRNMQVARKKFGDL